MKYKLWVGLQRSEIVAAVLLPWLAWVTSLELCNQHHDLAASSA